MFKGKSLHMPTVILIAASCAQPPCIEHLTRGGQTGRPYLYYDDATRRDESAVERARRLPEQKLHERGLKRIVRANKAMCLDQCAMGVTIVVYPEATWYGRVTLADVDEIIEKHIVGGEPVERLVIPQEKLTGIDPARSR